MARATSDAFISPRPTAAITSSIEARASRGRAVWSFSSEYFFFARANRRSTIRRPSPVYCSRTAVRVARRIAARAFPVTTMDSQALGGASWALDVKTSTSSPLASFDTKGAILPLILQPIVVLPMSVCTA